MHLTPLLHRIGLFLTETCVFIFASILYALLSPLTWAYVKRTIRGRLTQNRLGRALLPMDIFMS